MVLGLPRLGNMSAHCTVGSILCLLANMRNELYTLGGTFTYLEVLAQQLIWETAGCSLCHRTSFLQAPPTLKAPRGTPSQYKSDRNTKLALRTDSEWASLAENCENYNRVGKSKSGATLAERDKDTILESQ